MGQAQLGGYFAVMRESGEAWDDSRELTEQERWDEHAAFMNSLVDEGFVLLGGPVGGGPRTLLIVRADSEQAIHDRLDADPWTPMRMLRIASIEPWNILLGEVG
ncbi:MAG TPA: hypothetical protein VF895_04315 [Gaiellaceae bacterium]